MDGFGLWYGTDGVRSNTAKGFSVVVDPTHDTTTRTYTYDTMMEGEKQRDRDLDDVSIFEETTYRLTCSS